MGRNAFVVGGLIATPENRETLLVAFLDFAASSKLVVSFLNIGRNDLALFRRYGCQISKFGEEPVIDLEETTWNGKAYEWLRRQENFCTRQGVQFREIAHDPGDTVYRDQIVPELEEISQAHLASTLHGKELEFVEGRFRPLALGRRRLFVAVRQARMEAFAVCNPCLAGAMWAFEMYRHRPDATRGVIPYTMLQAMRKLKAEGVTYASLSLIPFVPRYRHAWRQPSVPLCGLVLVAVLELDLRHARHLPLQEPLPTQLSRNVSGCLAEGQPDVLARPSRGLERLRRESVEDRQPWMVQMEKDLAGNTRHAGVAPSRVLREIRLCAPRNDEPTRKSDLPPPQLPRN